MKGSVAHMIDKSFASFIFLFLIIAVLSAAGCVNYEAANRHLNYGMAYIETGQYTPALKELLEADKNNPRDHRIKYYLGVCYLGKGLAKEATVEFKKSVSMKPDYSEAHNYLGLIYTENGQLDEAIEEFQKALSNLLYETPSYAMSNLGWAYYKKGNYQAALNQYDEILKRDPNSPILPIVERNTGIILIAQGKYSQAQSHLRKGLEIAPEFVPEQIHYWMGKAYVGQGKNDEAESEFKKSVQIAPNSQFAADSSAELAKLRKETEAPAAKPVAVLKPETAARLKEPAPPAKAASAAPVAAEKKAAAPVKKEEPAVKALIVDEESAKPEARPSVHIVRKGETFYSIARAYGVPVQELCSANSKTLKYRLRTGERVTIPSSAKSGVAKSKNETLRGPRVITYRVKPGDSLTSVSRKFHTTMADIKKLNNLKRDTLDKGQVLKIRATQ